MSRLNAQHSIRSDHTHADGPRPLSGLEALRKPKPPGTGCQSDDTRAGVRLGCEGADRWSIRGLFLSVASSMLTRAPRDSEILSTFCKPPVGGSIRLASSQKTRSLGEGSSAVLPVMPAVMPMAQPPVFRRRFQVLRAYNVIAVEH